MEMSHKVKSVTIIITLCTISSVNSNCSAKYGHNPPQFTRSIKLRQGLLRGVVYEHRGIWNLPPIEIYRGIPYADPPTGDLRFMPPSGGPSWFDEKCADTFMPVCPQKFPDVSKMSPFRKDYFLRLKDYLKNQSEDCLYLNIYAPRQDRRRKYPVMVYIHGESFEWNSGNPYDGSVLAAYGNVVVVTLNFRLGILGFLKAGTEDRSGSNFGLVDQIAALLWVKANIAAFGGDPENVTLFGHGTGAVCASLLTISPMILRENNQRLFHRAILMGGTALADWALAANPSEVTYQVSRALNCQIQDDFAGCLRRKNLSDIMTAAGAITPPYKTRFGPIVDSIVVPNDPKKSMSQYYDIFNRFELMYGVTEQESIHLFGPVALTHGMLEKERDQELRKYLRSRCEMRPEHCLVSTLFEYTGSEFSLNDQKYGDYTGHEPDKASLARDALLDILSDARTVAPIVQMAKYHAALNLQSYFYVFSHKTHSKEYIRNKSFNGEELPYVFGIPLGGPKFHFTDSYTDKERLFSEVIMTYFCNFAYSGNPNVPRRNEFLTFGPAMASQFITEWPEFDPKEERYLELKIPPQPSVQYRHKEMTYWNDIFPKISEDQPFVYSPTLPITKRPNKTYALPTKMYSKHPNPPYRNPPPWIGDHFPKKVTSVEASRPISHQNTIGTVIRKAEKERPETTKDNVYGTVVESPPQEVRQSNPTTNMVIIIGGLFLLANIILLLVIYFKCYRNKKSDLQKVEETVDISEEEKLNKDEEAFLVNGCNIVRMMSKSSKSDTYEAVKCESTSRHKLSRQMSSSTIDAHTKVRDWIAQEIVNKYSPRFVRRPKQSTKTKIPVKEDISIPIEIEKDSKDSTLGRSPTRPVSPSDDQGFHQLATMKTSTITRPKMGRPAKVSVAIDATPTGRGSSVLKQQPIELTKSLDYSHLKPENDVPLRRSVTLEDFSPRVLDSEKELRKSSTSINFKYPETKSSVIKIEHSHSKSDPVQELNSNKIRKLKTFDPNSDVNVTSRDDNDQPIPLTPEESLMTIKRRKFPKVLPDHPGREVLIHKRRSMPAHSLFLPIPESSSFSQPNSPTNKNFAKLPPAPPPRTTTLPKQSSAPFVCLSEPMLAEEPYCPEPEVVCNNLYVGPLIPKDKCGSKGDELNTQPIYDSLRTMKQSESKVSKPKTIVTANPNAPIKRADPKIVVRPTISRKASDDKSTKNIPRVVAPDNQPQLDKNVKSEVSKPKAEQIGNSETEHKNIKGSSENLDDSKGLKTKRSQIPTPVKTDVSINKTSSSSESTPSEESDTGTVVKKI